MKGTAFVKNGTDQNAVKQTMLSKSSKYRVKDPQLSSERAAKQVGYKQLTYLFHLLNQAEDLF